MHKLLLALTSGIVMAFGLMSPAQAEGKVRVYIGTQPTVYHNQWHGYPKRHGYYKYRYGHRDYYHNSYYYPYRSGYYYHSPYHYPTYGLNFGLQFIDRDKHYRRDHRKDSRHHRKDKGRKHDRRQHHRGR